MGFSAWIDDQFSKPETAITLPSGQSLGPVQDEYLWRMVHAPDQLRQKVAYALSQIIVISANKNIYPPEIVPYLQILSKNAFGNYKSLLREISQSSQMGKYLDLANSAKPGVGGGANENYPRELMQLFTIGLVQLNPDGTPQQDGSGNSIPTYSQDTIEGFAHTFTGWSYPPKPGQSAKFYSDQYYSGPMVAFDNHHDKGAKLLLNGVTIPAGGTAQADLDAALANIFNHPNVGPFISKQLIQKLVMSNPSPDYVSRITRNSTPAKPPTRIYKWVEMVDGRPVTRYSDKPQFPEKPPVTALRRGPA